MFLLYINDLENASKVLLLLLLADYTNVLLTGHESRDLINSANAELIKVVNWLQVNILSLNVRKTKCFMFLSQNKHCFRDASCNVAINGESIQMVTSNTSLD